MKNKVIFINSGKASVGKTVFSRMLIEMLRNAKYVVGAIDADPKNEDLQHFFPLRNMWRGCLTIDINTQAKKILDGIAELEDKEGAFLIVDVKGAEIAQMLKIDSNLKSFCDEMNAELFFVTFFDSTIQSSLGLINIINMFQDARHIAVKSPRINDDDKLVLFNYDTTAWDFTQYLPSSPVAALEGVDGQVKQMPKLDDDSLECVNITKSLFFNQMFDDSKEGRALSKSKGFSASITRPISGFKVEFKNEFFNLFTQ